MDDTLPPRQWLQHLRGQVEMKEPAKLRRVFSRVTVEERVMF